MAGSARLDDIFVTLKSVFGKHVQHLHVKTDTAADYTLVSRTPSPFPQHKGQPMYFGQVRVGKAYVAFHLMPLYMNDELTGTISPELKKRMQGKTCFNFKTAPEPGILAELERLTASGIRCFREKHWV